MKELTLKELDFIHRALKAWLLLNSEHEEAPEVRDVAVKIYGIIADVRYVQEETYTPMPGRQEH